MGGIRALVEFHGPQGDRVSLSPHVQSTINGSAAPCMSRGGPTPDPLFPGSCELTFGEVGRVVTSAKGMRAVDRLGASASESTVPPNSGRRAAKAWGPRSGAPDAGRRGPPPRDHGGLSCPRMKSGDNLRHSELGSGRVSYVAPRVKRPGEE
jgi:hypothetical protein